jgi:hypothetical protein
MSICAHVAPLGGFVMALAIVVAPHGVHAGAWTLPEGEGQATVIGTWSNATHAFDAGGNSTATPRTEKMELQGLLEYGATDRFTVILTPGLQHLDIAAPVNATRSGFGYFELGGRYKLFGGPSWVISAQATLRAPGVFEPLNAAAIGYTDPETDLRALFGYGGSVGGMPAFVDLQLAQRFRAGTPPSEFRADATVGVTPWPTWMLLGQSFNVVAEGSAPPIFPNYAYHKLQLSVVHELTPAVAVQFGGFTTIAGHNALQENGMLLGVWYRFGGKDIGLPSGR